MMVIVRDEERGSKVTLYSSTPTDAGEWSVRDLTSYAVNAWEPSYDRELWKERGWLDIYVQDMEQGDGENVTSKEPTRVRMLEVSGEATVESASENDTHNRAEITVDLSDIAEAYGIDLADESSRARLALVVDAGASHACATADADGRATLAWRKFRATLMQDVTLAVTVDGVEVLRRVEPLILCASYELFDAMIPEGGEWTLPEEKGANAQFDLTERPGGRSVVVVDFRCRVSDMASLPSAEAMGADVQTALALSQGVLYAWAGGEWVALDGAEVEDGRMYNVRLVLDYYRRTVRCGIHRDDGLCMLPRVDGAARLALDGNTLNGIGVASASAFARLDGVLLARNGTEDAGMVILIR
jgi:hypothetical protein